MNKGFHKPKISVTWAWPNVTQLLKNKRRKSIWSLALVTTLLLISVVVALAVDGDFELGGIQEANIVSDGGTDWGSIFNADGTINHLDGGITAIFTADDVTFKGSKDATTFTGSAKNDDPIPSWTGGEANQITPKDELGNVYTYFKLNDAGQLLFYAGLERVDPGGDSHVDVEINQNEITYLESSGTFSGTKSIGDLLLAMNFTQGGDIGVVEIYEWTESGWNSLGSKEGEGCIDDNFCAYNNGEDIDPGPWDTYDDKGNVLQAGDKLPQNAFTEMGLNLGALIGSNECFASVQFHSRTSASFTSQLKDFAIQKFSLCEAPQFFVDPPTEAANEVGTDHTFTVKVLQKEFTTDYEPAVGVLVNAALDNDTSATAGFVGDDFCTTGADGTCSVTINSTTAGKTDVTFTPDLTFNGEPVGSVTASKYWVEATLEPVEPLPPAVSETGTPIDITVQLTFDCGTDQSCDNTPEGQTINFYLDGSTDPFASCLTDATGTCSISFDPGTTGPTSIVAKWTGDIGVAGLTASASAETVSVDTTWVGAVLTLTPESAANSVGDDHVITAKLQIDSGDGSGLVDADNETITFAIDDASSTAGSIEDPAECTTGTSGSGECEITLQSNSIGVTNVTGTWSGTVAGLAVNASDTATKSWIEVQLVLSPAAAANQVGQSHDITGTLQFNDGSGFQDAAGAEGDINFNIDSGPFGASLTPSCDPAAGSCIGTLVSALTGQSEVSANWSGIIDIGGGVTATVTSLVTAAPVNKTWVDAQLTLNVITGNEAIGGGTSVNDTHTVSATLKFDYGDGAGFVLAPNGEEIDFSVLDGPGILQSPEFCNTQGNTGTCTINLNFDDSSSDPGGTVLIEGTWMGIIDTVADSNPVTATATASTQVEATFFSVQASVVGGSEIACDPSTDPSLLPDPPNSVFGPGGLDPTNTGTSYNSAYEIPSVVFDPAHPELQPIRINCLYNNEDYDFWWMAPSDVSREIYVGLTTDGEANYDIAIFADLKLETDPAIQLEAISLLNTQAPNSSGSLSSGSLSSGSLSSGSLSSGSLSSGSLSSGSLSSGSLSSGSLSSGSLSSGSLSSGSFNAGNGDELAVAHVEAGQTVFIAVLSQAGDFGPKYAMRVDVKETDQGICTWTPQNGTSIVPPALPDPTGKKTGFFVNIGRFEATYGTAATQAMLDALQNPAFIDDPTVNGIVIPIEQDTDVDAAYADWNAPNNYCKIAKANGVSDAIRNLIVNSYDSLESVVIVGGPDQIPPRLVMEGPVNISPEEEYDSKADTDSPIYWWLKQNRILTYDFYVDTHGPFIRYLGSDLYEPEKPIGVLVEKPQDIINVINNYNAAGLQPQSCLISAYQHLTDAGEKIDALIDLPTQSLITPPPWTAANLLNAFGTNPELVSVNGHFEHWRALPAAGSRLVYAPEIISSMISNQVVGSTMGCHSSLNMPNNWVSTASPTPQGFHPKDDFAEVLLGNGWAAWYGTTSYAYGDDTAFKYTEQIMYYFVKAMNSSTGGTTVGEAYVTSKEDYFDLMATGAFDIFDVKSLRGAVLYGLPFQHVSIPLSVALDTLDPTISPAQKAALLAYPDVDEGAFVTQSEPVKIPYSPLSVSDSNQTFNLEQIDTIRGSYLRKVGGNNGDVVVSPGQPLQPLVSVNLSGQPHGVTMVKATFEDLTDFDPIVTNPATDTTRLESLLNKSRWFPPADGLWGLNLLGDTPHLNIIPGQYNTHGRIERKYNTMNLKVWDSDSTDFQAPGIWHPTSTCDDSGNVTFSMKVDDADGIQMVNIVHNAVPNEWNTTVPVGGVPTPTNLTVSDHPDGDGSYLAEGTFPLGSGVPYFVQAVDGVGNVNFQTNYGLNFLTCENLPDAVNNRIDNPSHALTVQLEINQGGGWGPFPGLAQVSGLVNAEGLGDVDVLNCAFGSCTVQISNIPGDGLTTLTFNDTFDVQPGNIVDGQFEAVGDSVTGSLSADSASSYTKEWWAGSVSIFKQVEANTEGQVCFTLSGPDISDDYQCKPFSGPTNLLFTWDELPAVSGLQGTNEFYTVTEDPPPSPLVGEGVIDDKVIVDEGHRDALVRTVLNRVPVCDLAVEKQCFVPATTDTTCDTKIAATLLRYTGPTILGATVEIKPSTKGLAGITYGPVDLINGQVLAPPEGGYTFDARSTATDIGPTMTITIKKSDGGQPISEKHHTSCSAPYTVGEPAPLNGGGLSPNWEVVSFVEKDGDFMSEEQLGDQCVAGAGSNVTYLYSLTNGGDIMTDVTLTDDKLGAIGSLPVFDTGETQEFSKVAQLNANTTNTVTATGYLSADQTCEATDTVTVTVGP